MKSFSFIDKIVRFSKNLPIVQIIINYVFNYSNYYFPILYNFNFNIAERFIS